jgi:hypothetical protein
MMTAWWRRRALVALLLAPAAAGAGTDSPLLLGYQGRILDDGQPQSRQVQIRFSLYAGPSGGTALWQETQALGLTDGYYSTFIGLVQPIDPTDFDRPVLYLELEVDEETLSPRQRLGSVAYALRASESRNADLLGGVGLADLARKTDLANYATKGDLASYATMAELANYATRSELSNYATRTDLANYATTAELSNYATKTDLASYATKAEVSTSISSSIAPLARKADLSQPGGTINASTNPLDWSQLKNVPAGLADGVDDVGTGGGGSSGTERHLEAELATGTLVGAVVTDGSASGGQARRLGAGDSGGNLYKVSRADLGAPLARGYGRVTIRLKVGSTGGSADIGKVECSARRAGAGAEVALAEKAIVPDRFAGAVGWGYLNLHCDWRADDQDQTIKVSATGSSRSSDLSVDDVHLVPAVPCDVEMAPVGDGRCIDRGSRQEQRYGHAFFVCADEGKHVCTFSEVFTAAHRGAISENGQQLRVGDLMYAGLHYFGGGGDTNGLSSPVNADGSTGPLTTMPGASSSGTLEQRARRFRCCR